MNPTLIQRQAATCSIMCENTGGEDLSMLPYSLLMELYNKVTLPLIDILKKNVDEISLSDWEEFWIQPLRDCSANLSEALSSSPHR